MCFYYSHIHFSTVIINYLPLNFIPLFSNIKTNFSFILQVQQPMLERPKKLNVPTQKQTIQVKIALVGNQQTGKSSLMSRYFSGECPNYYEATLGVQTFNKYAVTKNNIPIHITFWDFSGKEDFSEIRNQFYRQCSKVLVFADLSNKQSIDSIESWVKEIKQAGGNCPVVVIGNKADNKKMQGADKISKNLGCHYIQVSSKTGQNVNEMIEQVLVQFK